MHELVPISFYDGQWRVWNFRKVGERASGVGSNLQVRGHEAPAENCLMSLPHFSLVPPHEGHNDCLLPAEMHVTVEFFKTSKVKNTFYDSNK